MNISSTNNASSTFGKISTANTSNTPNTPIKAPVRTDDPNKTQEQSPKSTATIVIDEQAITLFKEKQTSQLAYSRSNNANYSDVGQDQPTVKNETAVAQYQAIDNLSERESVQKLFGVDLLA
jgi:hypothetical protein